MSAALAFPLGRRFRRGLRLAGLPGRGGPRRRALGFARPIVLFGVMMPLGEIFQMFAESLIVHEDHRKGGVLAGACRWCVACSYAYASFSNFASDHARP